MGISKKFLAKRESDILIHKAVKQAFDELKPEKLLTVHSLQDEYAQLESEEKQALTTYRLAKDDMLELLRLNARL